MALRVLIKHVPRILKTPFAGERVVFVFCLAFNFIFSHCNILSLEDHVVPEILVERLDEVFIVARRHLFCDRLAV